MLSTSEVTLFRKLWLICLCLAGTGSAFGECPDASSTRLVQEARCRINGMSHADLAGWATDPGNAGTCNCLISCEFTCQGFPPPCPDGYSQIRYDSCDDQTDGFTAPIAVPRGPGSCDGISIPIEARFQACMTVLVAGSVNCNGCGKRVCCGSGQGM